jgi:hypothetical protein
MWPKGIIERQPSTDKPLEGFIMSNVVEFKLKPKRLIPHRKPVRRIFYLGQTLLQAHGRSHLTEFSVRRSVKGTRWTLRFRMENIKEQIIIGTYGPEQIAQEVSSFGLNVTHEEWLKMGWWPPTVLKIEPCEVIPLFSNR